MFGALFSFLGGSVFRMIWGEVASFIQKKQDHAHELDMQRLQAELEDKRHQRDCERLRLQSELGVKEIQIAGDMAIQRTEVDAWMQAVKDVGKTTGIKFLDIWNGSVRPLLATLAILIVVAQVVQNGFVLTDWDRELVAAILGIYVADRSLMKRGK